MGSDIFHVQPEGHAMNPLWGARMPCYARHVTVTATKCKSRALMHGLGEGSAVGYLDVRGVRGLSGGMLAH